MMSAAMEVTNGNYSIINIKQFIDDIVSSVPDASLIRSNNSLYGQAGIKAAYGINKFIGLNGIFDLGYGETIQRDTENEVFRITGINADMNFYSLIKTPVSVSLGYLHSSYPRGENEAVFKSNIFMAQINYIGRTDFIMSFDFVVSRELTQSVNDIIWLKSIMFSMRYLF